MTGHTLSHASQAFPSPPPPHTHTPLHHLSPPPSTPQGNIKGSVRSVFVCMKRLFIAMTGHSWSLLVTPPVSWTIPTCSLCPSRNFLTHTKQLIRLSLFSTPSLSSACYNQKSAPHNRHDMRNYPWNRAQSIYFLVSCQSACFHVLSQVTAMHTVD